LAHWHYYKAVKTLIAQIDPGAHKSECSQRRRQSVVVVEKTQLKLQL
jgi:hypothetical protein